MKSRLGHAKYAAARAANKTTPTISFRRKPLRRGGEGGGATGGLGTAGGAGAPAAFWSALRLPADDLDESDMDSPARNA